MTGFSDSFIEELDQLMEWRRDVRHFKTDPVSEDLLAELFGTFALAPSVGLSEPWRLIRVTSAAARAAALSNFRATNTQALAGYSGQDAQTYASLKLSGMSEAPVHLAVFCDDGTSKGKNLGACTMPEMRRYSCVSAIMQFWLAARARGLGVGWVSILDPVQLTRDLDVPPDWSLIAYLCIGYPEQDHTTPELERVGWETRAETLPLQTR